MNDDELRAENASLRADRDAAIGALARIELVLDVWVPRLIDNCHRMGEDAAVELGAFIGAIEAARGK